MKSLKTHLKEMQSDHEGMSLDTWKSQIKKIHKDATIVKNTDPRSNWSVGVHTAHIPITQRFHNRETNKYEDRPMKQHVGSWHPHKSDPNKHIGRINTTRMKSESLEIKELKTSTLKNYLKTNLKKTVEKDGQPNPPLFKLKARAKGMETAISKLMKRESLEEAVDNAPYGIGASVICKKTYRPATVIGIEGPKVTVAYGDGSTQTGDFDWWQNLAPQNEGKTFRTLRIEAECRTPVEKDYYKAYRHLHFCKGVKGKSASSKSGGSFSSSNISGEGSSGNGGNGGGGDGGGGGGV